jgi:hypothetical protein
LAGIVGAGMIPAAILLKLLDSETSARRSK